MVTAPEPWCCAHEEEDTQLIDLLGKMMQKNPNDRISLEHVKAHPWVQKELGTRHRVSVDEYAKIEVNDDELREAVISGHVRPSPPPATTTRHLSLSITPLHPSPYCSPCTSPLHPTAQSIIRARPPPSSAHHITPSPLPPPLAILPSHAPLPLLPC